MKFLMSVIDHETGSSTAEENAQIDQFNDTLREGGYWIFAGGLSAPVQAQVIDNRSRAHKVSSGPLVAGEEYLSGFWLIEVPSTEKAMEFALQASLACNRRIELRALLG
ncbi:MAG: hypothetical protein RLZZ290_1564 [Pseudomonadota bacterium]|jgi:hypothetical protein